MAQTICKSFIFSVLLFVLVWISPQYTGQHPLARSISLRLMCLTLPFVFLSFFHFASQALQPLNSLTTKFAIWKHQRIEYFFPWWWAASQKTLSTFLPLLTCLVDLKSIDQTLCFFFICCEFLLLLVEEHQQCTGTQSFQSCGIDLVELMDFSSPGGGGLAFLHLSLCTIIQPCNLLLLLLLLYLFLIPAPTDWLFAHVKHRL